MRAGQVRRLYGELGGAERFGAGLAAVARGDLQEATHLASWTTDDSQDQQAFEVAATAALGLGWGFGIPAAERIGWLDALGLVTELLEESSLGADQAAAPVLDVLERARSVAAEGLASLRQALVETCEQVPGLDSELFLQAMRPPISDGLERHRFALEVAEPDEEQLQAARASLAEVLEAAVPPAPAA